MAGYSKNPLTRKLGIKEHSRVRIDHAPSNYLDLLQPVPRGVKISNRLRSNIDICHLFIKSKNELTGKLKIAMSRIPQNGMIWVSWPKKASGVLTDMNGDRIREAAFPLGLVDIKVCAVDEVWSGLKLVIRKSNRR